MNASAVIDDEVTATVVADGLTKRYRRNVALEDCSFVLRPGEVTALVGANGAGKTTLLGILAGQLRADAGSVQMTAKSSARAEQGTARVAIVTQDKPLYRSFTARNMLEFGRRTNTRWNQRRADRWLAEHDVPLDRQCRMLSGGQQTQVALAIAVASCPDVLLLDEPLADLDPLARADVARRLMEYVADTGTALVLSTHVVSELRGIADNLLLLSKGRLVLEGQVDEVTAAHALLTGPSASQPPGPCVVIESMGSERQSRFLVRWDGPVGADGESDVAVHPAWVREPVGLEELVVAYLRVDRDARGADKEVDV